MSGHGGHGADGGAETRRVRVGAPRRGRAVLGAVVGLAVVVVLGLVAGGRGDAPGRDGSPPSPPPTARIPTTGASTTRLPGGATGAVAGPETEWHLVVVADEVTSIDLATGQWSDVDGLLGGLAASAPDGVLMAMSTLVWHPFPFDPGTAVDLGPVRGRVLAVAGDRVWVARDPVPPEAAGDVAEVSLEDGGIVAWAPLPAGSSAVGRVGAAVVVAVEGGTAVVTAEGAARLSDAEPLAVAEGVVLARRCPAEGRCALVAVDPSSGEHRPVDGIGDDASPAGVAGPAHPDGRAVLTVATAGGDRGALLVGAEAAVPLLPPGLAGVDLWGSAWSPDGTLLFVPLGVEVLVVDPFAVGGPREVASFPAPGWGRGRLAVVQPRTED